MDTLNIAEELGVQHDQVKTLVLIDRFNAHEFRGLKDTKAYDSAMIGLSSSYHASFAALYRIGSKVEHSCFPNVSYSSKTGGLVYTATRPIEPGDRLSYSYSDGAALDCPVEERQAEMQRCKAFLCRCSRCEGPDFCRPLPSPCCAGQFALMTAPAGAAAVEVVSNEAHSSTTLPSLALAVWTCQSCGLNLGSKEMALACETEAALHRSVRQLDMEMQAMGVRPGLMERAKALQVACRSALPWMHFL